MKQTFPPEVESGRIPTGPYRSKPGDRFGAFRLRHPKSGQWLRLIVCSAEIDEAHSGRPGPGWDHVSVSPDRDRCPTWDEMCWVKSLFWGPDEVVVQYHPAESRYVRNHPNVLHLWRCPAQPFAMPPVEAV